MDGTLTLPSIDFAAMRRRLGIPTADILATLKTWPEARRRMAWEIVEELEEKARRDLVIQPGAAELLALLDRHSLPKGIVTRNSGRTVDCLLAKLSVSFSAVVTRDFEPVKPDPAPVLHICRQWRIPPVNVLVVGDYRDDLLCGKAAGCRTCLLKNERNAAYADLADFVVESLPELCEVVKTLI